MQRALGCAAQHFTYSSITGAFMGETGRYDAFETILEVLRAMLDHPGTPPEDLAKVDADFKRFMNCGANEMEGPPVEAFPETGLCTHSEFEDPSPKCYLCLRGSTPSHGVPGGAICCHPNSTHRTDLSQCPRPWE
eukprot:gene16629-22876_t